jgi:organic hydroperoxide reductase OsmC/OhrA
MHPFPHRYVVQASAIGDETILRAPGVPSLSTAAPPQFGGTGDRWSPETLLVGATVDCLLLTFRTMATASKLPWKRLTASAEGTLDRVDGVTRFTALTIRARLTVPEGVDEVKAERLLEKAKQVCLISNSLAAPTTLDAQVVADRSEPAEQHAHA